jgi:uncharacterized protein (DUF983 family)
LSAMAAVGAMMPTDRAIASMTPNCGRSLLISPFLHSKRAGSPCNRPTEIIYPCGEPPGA